MVFGGGVVRDKKPYIMDSFSFFLAEQKHCTIMKYFFNLFCLT